MTEGKISNAIRGLSDEVKGGVLSLNDKITKGNKTQTVFEILQEKHPKKQPANPNYVVEKSSLSLPYHPVIFDKLNTAKIRKAAMKTHGSQGPSGLDAQEWRRMLTSFKTSSNDLCKTVSKLAIRIATEELDFLDAYNGCRLIALDKCPGVRPIGVGEVLRRIIGRSILACLKNDLKLLGGVTQLCLGQKCGIEHAIHSLRESFEDTETEAILLIDAQNAFNSLNRELAIKNIESLCHALVAAVKNSYSKPSNLFINGKIILSEEGTTQGDPLAMPMYGIALLPLIELCKQDRVLQKWYADDGNAAGKLKDLRILVKKLQEHGPAFGYNVIKCNLITKPEKVDEAKKLFSGCEVEIVEGHRVLGSVIGAEHTCAKFIAEQSNAFI